MEGVTINEFRPMLVMTSQQDLLTCPLLKSRGLDAPSCPDIMGNERIDDLLATPAESPTSGLIESWHGQSHGFTPTDE